MTHKEYLEMKRLVREHEMGILNKKSPRIINLNISTRLYNCLKDNGITNLHQVEDYTYEEVLKFHLMGKTTIKELELVLNQHGFKFKRS